MGLFGSKKIGMKNNAEIKKENKYEKHTDLLNRIALSVVVELLNRFCEKPKKRGYEFSNVRCYCYLERDCIMIGPADDDTHMLDHASYGFGFDSWGMEAPRESREFLLALLPYINNHLQKKCIAANGYSSGYAEISRYNWKDDYHEYTPDCYGSPAIFVKITLIQPKPVVKQLNKW